MLFAAGTALPSDAAFGLFPYVQSVRGDRAVILWTTLESPGSGEVQYSPNGKDWMPAPSSLRVLPPSQTSLPYMVFQHRVELQGLRSDTDYSYRVIVDGRNLTPASTRDEELRFHSAGGARFRFLVFGDSGDGGPAQMNLTRLLQQEKAAFVLHTGDLAYQDGTFQQLESSYFNVYRSMMTRMPFFPVPGNHDYQSQLAAGYRTLIDVPSDDIPPEGRGLYYSLDWGPIHLTALDSNLSLISASGGEGAMLRWLEQDLAKASNQWLIVTFHHTPFPVGHHKGDANCMLAQQKITPILERYGVHLAVSGHEHLYMRSQTRRGGVFHSGRPGTAYVTTGGGGSNVHAIDTPAPFAEVMKAVPHYLRSAVDGLAMQIQAVDGQGGLVDDFWLTTQPEIDPDGVRDAASFSQSVAAGGLITITGKDLSWSGGTIAASSSEINLAGVGVALNGQPVHLLFVSRTQINAQLPYGTTGTSQIEVSGPNGSCSATVQIQQVAPAIFQVQRGDSSYPAIVHQNGRLVSDQDPAQPAEWLSLYATGLGPVMPPVVAGEPLSVLHRTITPARVEINGQSAEVNFSGIAPGYAGLNQVNFRVPQVSGTSKLRVWMSDVSSNTVALAVN